jgi:proliferating cell nuclear antigen
MVKAAGKADEVVLEMGLDYPMKMKFKINKNVSIIYLMAPRIEQEN